MEFSLLAPAKIFPLKHYSQYTSMKFIHEDLGIEVPEGVYYPAEDSFLLVDVLEAEDILGENVLEMGCGSGFLSILCAKRGADVTAADITEEAVNAAKTNAQSNGLKIHIVQSDLFENVNGKFDIIVFNPPYLPKEDDEEGDITYTGGQTGREVIEKFIAQCKWHLEDKGRVLLLISSLTGYEEVIACFNDSGFSVKTKAKQKLDWEELIVIEARTV